MNCLANTRRAPPGPAGVVPASAAPPTGSGLVVTAIDRLSEAPGGADRARATGPVLTRTTCVKDVWALRTRTFASLSYNAAGYATSVAKLTLASNHRSGRREAPGPTGMSKSLMFWTVTLASMGSRNWAVDFTGAP